MKKQLLDFFPDLIVEAVVEAIEHPTNAELESLGWDEERSGWYDHEGYQITIHGPHGRYAAVTPDGKTIAKGLGSFRAADKKVDQFKKRNPDY